MKLNKLHVLQRYPCLISQVRTAPRIDHRIGRPKIDAAVSPCSEQDHLGMNRDYPAFEEMKSEHTDAPSFDDHQSKSVPLFVNRNVMGRDLLVQSV